MSNEMPLPRQIALRRELSRFWVSVEEELPSKNGSLTLVYAPGFEADSVHFVDYAIYAKDGWLGARTGEPLSLKVTHWMPVPNPPSEQQIVLKIGENQIPVDANPLKPPDQMVLRGRDKVVVYVLQKVPEKPDDRLTRGG